MRGKCSIKIWHGADGGGYSQAFFWGTPSECRRYINRHPLGNNSIPHVYEDPTAYHVFRVRTDKRVYL
jgi:hypothetical protein